MKKWIIAGVIIGLIGPICVRTIYPTLFKLVGDPYSKASIWLETSLLVLFPFSICLLDSESFVRPLWWSIFIVISLLNIGLYIFLSLMMQKICLFVRNLKEAPK